MNETRSRIHVLKTVIALAAAVGAGLFLSISSVALDWSDVTVVVVGAALASLLGLLGTPLLLLPLDAQAKSETQRKAEELPTPAIDLALHTPEFNTRPPTGRVSPITVNPAAEPAGNVSLAATLMRVGATVTYAPYSQEVGGLLADYQRTEVNGIVKIEKLRQPSTAKADVIPMDGPPSRPTERNTSSEPRVLRPA